MKRNQTVESKPQKTRPTRYGNYIIFNYGTVHSFDPNKRAFDMYTGKEVTLLDIHMGKVIEANNSKMVHILDNNLKIVKPGDLKSS